LIAKVAYTCRFSFFWLDDFNNLYWVQPESGWSILRHIINPASDFFRPVGMAVYWALWRIAGLNAFPYHAAAWTLHAVNVVLMYLLLKSILGSRFAAAAGVLLFGLRANFVEIYWSFGFIFELLACLLMLLALIVHSREKRSYGTVVLVLVLTVLAIKSKEMAITLPGLLLVYDLTQKRNLDRKAAFQFLGLGAISLWFLYFKLQPMAGTSRDHPYFLDLTWLTLGRGYGWYFDRLYGLRLRWGAWAIITLILFLWMLYKRERRGIFFLAYIFISLLPVVFLINHRLEAYWYIPFLGFAGIVAVGADALRRRVRFSSSTAAIGLAVYTLLAWFHYSRETRLLGTTIASQQSVSEEYAMFVRQLRELPQPAADETIYYRSFPRFFSGETLQSVTQVALRRTDVRTDVVKIFPEQCRYCLSYEDGAVKLENRVR
jgi:hypothetical protein